MTSRADLDVVVVGAGFAGIFALHRLRGLGLSVQVFEAGSGVGGTWFWNRYPGARCDVESMEYSYQFSEELQQEWEWSERYSPQPEILAYLNHVVDRFDLRDGIQCDTRVASAHYDEASMRWRVTTEAGERVSARFVVMATGCLSARNTPSLEGLESFEGDWYHTGEWPHEGVDLRGKRVGVIGTGSSAIQAIPVMAEQARHLSVFQRTASYSVPAWNRPLAPELQAAVKADYAAVRAEAATLPFGFRMEINPRSALEVDDAERHETLQAYWERGGLYFMAAFRDLISDERANATAADFIRDKIRSIVEDPAVAERLMPDTSVGCKRLCADTGYFEAFNRQNVRLVDVREDPIERVTRGGLATRDAHYELDTLVFATGFDAMTGALLALDIRGVGGLSLQEKWAEGPRAYLGLGTAGFPNLFTVTGPGSPSVLSNMVPSIEQHVNFIADCIAHLDDEGFRTIESTPQAEEDWMAVVGGIASKTIYPGCNSWYLGANIPGKPRIFMPYLGFPTYVAKCEEVVAQGYEGFALSR